MGKGMRDSETDGPQSTMQPMPERSELVGQELPTLPENCSSSIYGL